MNIINIHLVGIWHYLQKASEFFCTYLFARTLSEKLDDFLVRHSELSQGDVDIQTPFSLQQIDLINMQRKILVIAKKKRSKIFSLFFLLLTISDIYNASSIRITKNQPTYFVVSLSVPMKYELFNMKYDIICILRQTRILFQHVHIH